MIDALFFSRTTFSFFEATAVHCASDAATIWWHVWGDVLVVERATISSNIGEKKYRCW